MVRARMLTLALLVMAVACSAETPEAEPVSPGDDVEVSPDTDAEPAEDDIGEDEEEVSADAGEDAEEPSADAGEDASTEPGVTVGFNPRMVLYDGDGEPVEAVVTSAPHPPTPSLDVGDEWDPYSPPYRCVPVAIPGPNGQVEQVTLRMDNASLLSCQFSVGTSANYLTPDCSGTPYSHTTYHYYTYVLDGVPMRPSGRVIEVGEYWRTTGGECVASTGPATLIPLEAIPSWIINAFPNPPYEVRLEF